MASQSHLTGLNMRVVDPRDSRVTFERNVDPRTLMYDPARAIRDATLIEALWRNLKRKQRVRRHRTTRT